jgi:hypothetical protein
MMGEGKLPEAFKPGSKDTPTVERSLFVDESVIFVTALSIKS